MRSNLSLLSLLDPLWPGVVTADMAPCIGHIEPFDILTEKAYDMLI